jgi:putative mRNA 3-end processing factor
MRLQCNGFALGLDSPEGDFSFLSHAHKDHSAGMGRQKKIIASEETLAIVGLEKSACAIPDGVNLKMLDAGHMLGSRQLVLEEDGRKTAYSGDISLKENVFGHKAEIPQCDRLIMEATYGSDPVYKFPGYEQTYEQISSFIRSNDSSNILLGCYELGKAQEMVRILNERCGIAPVVNESTEEICRVYGRFGVKLDRLVIGSEEAEEVMNRRFVAVVPMRHAKRYFARRLADAFGKKTLCAAITGWALTMRFDADAAFPLSDHADFHELREYIIQSGAKEVEFFCGDGRRLLESLRP